ncbi:MAG: RnfABCDGE type electron transport complex subunit D [Clostridia bacterium]|nr:RnfABCDGE type electron transport complex subunit D [Clostridia bacterium]
MNGENKMLTVSASPHMKSWETSRVLMLDVIIAMVPALIWSVYAFGFRALSLTVISVASCVIFEFLTQKLLKRPVTVLDFSAAVTGVLIAFNLPASTPLWIPAIGAFFAIVIVKQLYGGIGKNIVNPALAARVFLFIAWPNEIKNFIAPSSEKLSAFSINVDAVATATPLASLKQGVTPDVKIFDMFLGNTPGCLGEVSALLLIIGGIYLLVRKVITWHIPVAFLGTVAVISYLFPLDKSVHAWEFMLMELLSGGLILGAIFMATDYVTSPVTKTGRIIYGVGCGLITVFIRYFGGYSEGVSFAILIMNLLVWYIDQVTRPRVFGIRKEKKKKEKEAA